MESFHVFYSRYHSLLLGVAQQRLVGMSSAEDVVAEAFAIAWSHYREGGELTLPWLYQVLRNLIGNEYQRVARANQLYERIGRLTGDSAFPIASDDALDIRRCLSYLREEDRDIIYMAYWEDLDRTEIAAILGISAVSLRVRLLRARRALKLLLDEVFEPTRKEATDGRA